MPWVEVVINDFWPNMFFLSLQFKGRTDPEQKIQTLPGAAGEQWEWVWVSASSAEMLWPALVYHEHPKEFATIDFWEGGKGLLLSPLATV